MLTPEQLAEIERPVPMGSGAIWKLNEQKGQLLAEVKRLRAEVTAESIRADVWRAAYEGTLSGLAQQVLDAQEEFSGLLIDEHQGGEG